MTASAVGNQRVLARGRSWVLRRRHYSILQSFPADWVWAGTESLAVHLIGNAVPPLLAWRSGQAFDPAEKRGGSHPRLFF